MIKQSYLQKKPKEADNNVSDFFNVNTSATILVDNIHDNDNHNLSL